MTYTKKVIKKMITDKEFAKCIEIEVPELYNKLLDHLKWGDTLEPVCKVVWNTWHCEQCLVEEEWF